MKKKSYLCPVVISYLLTGILCSAIFALILILIMIPDINRCQALLLYAAFTFLMHIIMIFVIDEAEEDVMVFHFTKIKKCITDNILGIILVQLICLITVPVFVIYDMIYWLRHIGKQGD